MKVERIVVLLLLVFSSILMIDFTYKKQKAKKIGGSRFTLRQPSYIHILLSLFTGKLES